MDACSVLVVEDDPGVRALMVELLAEAGYTVLEAMRGEAGLHLAATCAPAVIVVNHVLPDMTGLEFVARVRQRQATREIPVMLVTGLVQQITDGAPAADRVLPLPFDIDALLTQVAQLAEDRRGAVA